MPNIDENDATQKHIVTPTETAQCKWCGKEFTFIRRGPKPRTRCSAYCYNKYQRKLSISECSDCGATKEIMARKMCSTCYKKFWIKNVASEDKRESYRLKKRARDKQYRDDARQKMRDLKESMGCVDCGVTDHRVLDFDHTNPSEKVGGITWMIMNSGWNKVMEEVKKCEVRCSNCHRIKTFNKKEWAHHA